MGVIGALNPLGLQWEWFLFPAWILKVIPKASVCFPVQRGHRSPARHRPLVVVLAVALGATSSARAYGIYDELSIGGTLGMAGQCQKVSGLADSENLFRGAVRYPPEPTYNPTGQDQFFVKFGFAAGNGLNEDSPCALAPWAADMEDGV